MAAKDIGNIVLGGAAITIGADVGYIKEGIKVAPQIEHYFVEGIEGLLTSPKARRTKESYQVSFNFVEVTRDNLKLGWDVTNDEDAGPDPITLEIGGDSADPQIRVIVAFGTVPKDDGGGTEGYIRSIQFERTILMSAGESTITQFGEVLLPATYVTLHDNVTSHLVLLSDAQS